MQGLWVLAYSSTLRYKAGANHTYGNVGFIRASAALDRHTHARALTHTTHKISITRVKGKDTDLPSSESEWGSVCSIKGQVQVCEKSTAAFPCVESGLGHFTYDAELTLSGTFEPTDTDGGATHVREFSLNLVLDFGEERLVRKVIVAVHIQSGFWQRGFGAQNGF